MVQVKIILLSIIILFGAYYYYKIFNENEIKLDSPIIETSLGSLKGIISSSRDGREYYEYLGIPYAKPPIGELRFEPPQPGNKWEGILDVRTYGSVCLQADVFERKIHGTEDCLFLNVFVPNVKDNSKLLPTMVWIHGGMFVFGSSDLFRPDYFMDHDIILVTINYRLGPLGFFNTGDEVVRGNMGLKDQNMALKWVQANIKNFGGDPSKVTIFGESAGGASAHHHMLSPLSKGLFQKAISQSGTALNCFATRTNAEKQAKTFSKLFGCPTENTKSMTNCMKVIGGIKLMEASYSDLVDDLRDPITVFNPSIENIKDKNAFITELPIEILKRGNFTKLPWITGINAEEGLLISAALLRDSKFTEISQNLNHHMPNLMWHDGKINPNELQKIKDFYFGKNQIDSIDKFQNWTNFFGDYAFGAPAQQAIQLQSKYSPVYAYYYSYKGGFTLTNYILAFTGKYPLILEYMYYIMTKWFNKFLFGIEPIHYGACHADELAFLFCMKDNYFISPSDKEYNMSKNMVKSWVSFASDSIESESLQFNGISWPTANSKSGQPLQYMHMDIQSSIILEPNSERNVFCNNIKL